jgi:hypothetical protein
MDTSPFGYIPATAEYIPTTAEVVRHAATTTYAASRLAADIAPLTNHGLQIGRISIQPIHSVA